MKERLATYDGTIRMPGSCGLVEASCACILDHGHGGPHECDCGGSWDFDAEGAFIAVRFPQRMILAIGSLPPMVQEPDCQRQQAERRTT